MNIPPGLLPEFFYWLAAGLFLLALFWSLWSADWRALQRNHKTNLLFGSVVALMVLWRMKAGIHPGLDFHLLGATLVLLMFGWAFAFLALSLLVFGDTVASSAGWLSYPLNVLIMGGVPLLLSLLLQSAVRRFLPRNFFVYALVGGYLTAALAMVATLLVASAILIGFESYTLAVVQRDYLVFTPFMAFAEAFLTGVLVAGMALFKPEWLRSFDDRVYLSGK